MKLKFVMPPLGSFEPVDIYYCKCWRRMLHKVHKPWVKWYKELIQTLQEQKLCRRKPRNFQKGGIVLLKADFNQNHWPIAPIIEMFPDKQGVVHGGASRSFQMPVYPFGCPN